MKKIFFSSLLLIVVFSCTKGKVETVPTVSIKSFSTDIVDPYRGINVLEADLNFTDKEGDLDSVIVIRQRSNVRGRNYKQIPFPVPRFDGQSRGELAVYMDYSNVLTLALTEIRIPGGNGRNEPDTLQLKFRLKDKAGNYSDSTNAKQLIVIR